MQTSTRAAAAACALGAAFYLGYRVATRAQSKRCRVTFKMELNGAQHVAEYTKRHDGTDPYFVGPESYLHRQMVRHGVHNYSIHYDPATRALFAYAELDDPESLARVAATEECATWWLYMEKAGLMRYNDDTGTTMKGGATPWSAPLTEVFHMR